MALPVTAFFAGVLGFWILILQWQVIRFRRSVGVSLGAGPENRGERVIRAHGNAVETIPIFLVLLGLAEGLATPTWVVGLLAALFSAGRLMHGLHFLDMGPSRLRVFGMILTLSCTAFLCIGLIGHALAAMGQGAG